MIRWNEDRRKVNGEKKRVARKEGGSEDKYYLRERKGKRNATGVIKKEHRSPEIPAT